MGISAGFALLGASLALASPAPPCTQVHRCHQVLHVGPTGSDTGHVDFDSPQLFPDAPLAILVHYSPRLPTDTGLRIDPVGTCGIHFVLPARFTGFANRCGTGKLPLHVQVANVTLKHLRVGITYWSPRPLFTG